MLTIQDEQLARDLEAMAARQHSTVEDLLRTFVASSKPESQTTENNLQEQVSRLREKLYTRARNYWREKGDMHRGSLSNAVLQETFWGFDVNGVPYLKSDVDHQHPPQNALVRLAFSGQRRNLAFSETGVARNSRAILEEHFADHILKRSKRPNGED
jgi:hypothetical protein